MALKEYLIQEISEKMKHQGECRMKKEIRENIESFKKSLKRHKKNEYKDLNATLDDFLRQYKTENCS
jgi:glucosamine 6-phosphate synthetase-like amidotransferase/phosphosugar isomerase protein